VKLTSNSIADGLPIPARYALGVPDPATHVSFGANVNPHVRWSDAPSGTRSFALVMHDSQVPSVGTDVNREDRTVPRDLPRVDFFHWVLVDIPADIEEIPEGAVSRGVTPRGKPVGATGFGRAGRNDYTSWFAGDAQMEGVYGGYDGPGPPWNDERVHVYHLTVFALDTEKLDLPESFDGNAARRAMEGHVLDSASLSGTYAIYARAR
jgi:Raf kinase inhibitor-like YbhB/YbcL family protein